MTWNDLTAEEQQLERTWPRIMVMEGDEIQRYWDVIVRRARGYRRAHTEAITDFLRRRRSNGRGEPATETGNI